MSTTTDIVTQTNTAAKVSSYTIRRARLRAELIERDGPHCRWPDCYQETDLQIHHIIPECFGGRAIKKNTCLLCDYHHVLIHKFFRMPDPGQRQKLKPQYVAAWDAMHSVLQEVTL